jgi:hypothetical protein
VRAIVTSTATGDVLLERVRVVTIRDGRLGFSASPAHAVRLLADPRVTLTAPDRTFTGVAEVVRSGTAYEEVRGRTRMAEGRAVRWAATGWRRRRETAVVLVREVS